MLDDPFAIDRRLRETARAWRSFRQALRSGAGEEHRFQELGAFASAELVTELRAASATDPLAPALSRWAYRLYLEHATRELVAGRERAFRGEPHALDAPESGKFTLREMLGAALANVKGRRSGFLDAFAAHAATAKNFELRRWERRIELSNALGDASPDPVELPAASIVSRARRFLDETWEPIAELRAKDFGSIVEVALGQGSVASWPSHLSVRSLAGLFDEAKWLASVQLELEELPEALGPASFLRGLVGFGAALRTALAGTSLPFALAHDPFDLPGARFGALLALVPFGASFSRRKLDVSRARLADHRRLLSLVVLVGARTSALRVALRGPTLGSSSSLGDAYAELTHQAFGVELRPSARAVLLRSRVSDPQRFAGLLLAADDRERLERTHDDDWYRNPRAVEELRETTRLPVETRAPEDALDRGSGALLRLLANPL